MSKTTDDGIRNVLRPARRRWPAWAGYAAFLWTVLYGTLGLYWTFGGPGFPFGAGNDPGAELSFLVDVNAKAGAPVIPVLGLVGSAVALAMARTWGRGILRLAMLAFAWMTAIALTLIVPDFRVLLAVIYVPLFLIGAATGWLSVDVLDVVSWPVMNQFLCIVGGLLWGSAALAYQRRSRDACSDCGRSDTAAGWTAPSAAARWGAVATAVAASIPLLYAITRWAWFLGIPLGITEAFLREGQTGGSWMTGAVLATLGAVGAVLTLGLVRPWGEVFPRWVPFIGGKRVPLWLAILPASLVSILVTVTGLMFVRLYLAGAFGDVFGEGNWAAIGPLLLWPLWGVALGVATLAYYYRRRGQCRRCGRGSPAEGGRPTA